MSVKLKCVCTRKGNLYQSSQINIVVYTLSVWVMARFNLMAYHKDNDI